MEEPWLAEATDWIDACLAEHGLEREGPVESERMRPWGTVLRARAGGATVWLKAPGGATRFEVPLYELLARRAPERVLVPLSLDVGRGWVLLPDGGLPAGERFPPERQVEVMAQALPVYAELQLRLAEEVPAMLEIGVADMRPEAMPARFDEALERVGALVDGPGAIGDRAGLDAVGSMRRTYAGWCERLAGSPVPASLDHNDLHAHNVIAGASGGFEDARFYDWGDAVVAHPFASALGIGYLQGIGRRDAERLRDAYLEPFAGIAPKAELVETLGLAARVGKVARALTWQRAIGADPQARWADGPYAALTSLLDDTWLGSA